jgi:hypothetical protein
MLPQHILFSFIVACAAVPLNINLGAYSPALVVGDGEISLGSKESASELMATLASGAAENQQQQQGQQANVEPQPQEGGQQGEAPAPPAQAPPAEAPAAEGEQQAEQPAEENAAKRSTPLVRTIDHLGKRSNIAVDDRLAAVEGAMQWIKRDIEGFNAALSYAREAMKNTPKIEMGSEGAGVGIVVNPGLNVPANSAANGQPAAERKVRRSDVVEESETPKMTLVAITEV